MIFSFVSFMQLLACRSKVVMSYLGPWRRYVQDQGQIAQHRRDNRAIWARY